jgi:hypothetical protein
VKICTSGRRGGGDRLPQYAVALGAKLENIWVADKGLLT